MKKMVSPYSLLGFSGSSVIGRSGLAAAERPCKITNFSVKRFLIRFPVSEQPEIPFRKAVSEPARIHAGYIESVSAACGSPASTKSASSTPSER